jgi:hypothetical protein
MLAVDRPGSDDREVPAVPDTSRPEEVMASTPDRGPVLTDARLRQEYALAYRAKVDALYEQAEPDAARGGTGQSEVRRRNIVDKYPGEYQAATHDPPHVAEPHESPENWTRRININESLPGRDNNCGECARAACETWYGKPAAAAAISAANSLGEPTSRMEEWAGQRSLPVTMVEIGRRLEELGPGSSAIIGCKWNGRGGHWFNAFNDAGMVKAVDAQSDLVGSWPPVRGEVGFEESQMKFSDAIFFGPDGKVLRNDHT